ncbi:hydrophobic/amphiphilic exporter-1 (mainly G- bacteria), HAE1 family [Legionella steelei]|uniref:Hydrophobic/amphiphilic exporter-1 (Mainly G-bacteria), HAE1 family n=1 Tax=Legionella steelei TaxID=947033 RepID=A0A0W0ZJF2_9GAMM|nr:efflux RND transporter permease subunit [Legionella steelei]KTD69022.1 hydrophobic/amphiphilic exporter-1 (mainly G- bacteria), HAE1 family [Legionella steelei]
MEQKNLNKNIPKRPLLNSAGKLARAFIHSKLTLLIIIGSLLFGILALELTPRTYNPEIVVPVVAISVSRPGSDAHEMLHQIIRPLEGLMASIPGVDHTYGMAVDDNAIVTVRFKVNENEENSLVKVYNQINSNMDKMPAGTLIPLVQSISLYDVPLLTITLSSSLYSGTMLQNLATRVLEELRGVPQVGKSWVMGASPSALRVWLDPDKMASHFIPLQKIKQALEVNNVSFNAGKLEPDLHQTPLRVEGNLISPEDLGKVIIGVDNGKPVLLKDIAQIELAPADDTIQSYFAFGPATLHQNSGQLKPAVTIALARQKGSNGVEVANAVLERLKLVQQNNIIPKEITTTITRNYGDDANDAVNTLVEHLGIAIASVVILLMLFLGWREASIVIFSIPLILCIVLGIGWIAGQTINRITLFALILSLGLLVDDSIVVIENIHRHMQERIQHNFSRLVVFAANEIGKPTIIATFTVILALIPMAFVSGMMGPFMGPIPFNAPLAMLVSLIIAYTVVPYLAYRWLKSKARRLKAIEIISQEKHHLGFIHKMYLYLFTSLSQSRWKRYLFYGFVFALLILVMIQPLWQFIRPSGTNGPLSTMGVELKMLPDDNVNTFLIEVNAGAGASLEQTRNITKDISHVLAQNHFVTNYQLFLGQAAPEDFAAMVRGDAMQRGTNYAQIRVNLINKHQRSIGSHEIAQQFYDSLSDVRHSYPLAHIKLFESPPGPPVRSQMEAGLYGPDYEQLRTLGQYISNTVYPKIYGMINIDNSVTENLSQYTILINRNATVLAGLLPSMLANDILGYFKGVQVGNGHRPGLLEPENIILRLPKLSRENSTALKKLYLLNQQSQLVPLAKVVDFKSVTQEKPIFTRDQHQVVYVTGEMLHSSPAYAVATTTHMLKHLELPNESQLTVGNLGFKEEQPQDIARNQLFWLGEMRLTLDVFRDLGSAFIVAIVLIYILLTGFYRSFFIPLIIMGAIPLTIIGVFPGHWIMHQPFTATSMIGVIALAGIVVRNSLLLIDFILENQRSASSIEIAVTQSGVVRLTPILLTALAIILGSSVMLSDPVFGGLAISLIFGAFASTILTLFLIPLLYLSWWKWRHS